jgi:hypothetical protein
MPIMQPAESGSNWYCRDAFEKRHGPIDSEVRDFF